METDRAAEEANHSAAEAAQCGGSEVRIHTCRGFVLRTSEPKPH